MDLSLIIFLYLPLSLMIYATAKNLLHKIQNLPPGPFFMLPLVGHIYLLNKPLHKKFYQLSKKYGPVFSLQLGSRHAVIVSSPSAIEECLSKTNDIIFANRPRFLAGKYLGGNYTSISWAPYGDHWRNLRRISSIELLSSNRINSLSEIRLDEVRTLIRHLFQASFGNPEFVVEMRTVIFELMFNIMTRMLLGKRYYGKDTVNSKEAKEFQDIIDQKHRIVGKSAMNDFIPFLNLFKSTENKYRAVRDKSSQFFQDLINEIRARGDEVCSSEEKGKTIIEVLLSLQETDPDYYSDEIIKGLNSVLLQGGSDTSVATLEWTMTLLLNNPETLKKTQAEIDRHAGHDRLIDETDVFKIPYLGCIINETLRIYPVLPLLLPRESSEACTVGGFHVRKGTMLFINAWAVQNDPKIWEDAEKFKPERFMEVESVNGKAGIKYLPFGKGRRGCPGEALGLRMLGLVLGSLIQCFDWNKVEENMVDVGEKNQAFASKAVPLMAKCQPRANIMSLLAQIT